MSILSNIGILNNIRRLISGVGSNVTGAMSYLDSRAAQQPDLHAMHQQHLSVNPLTAPIYHSYKAIRDYGVSTSQMPQQQGTGSIYDYMPGMQSPLDPYLRTPTGTTATGGAQTYTVQPGDTLSAIAARFGVSVDSITGYRSGDPNLIYPGETLTIGGAGQAAGAPSGVTGAPTGQPGLTQPPQQPMQGIEEQRDMFQATLDGYQLAGVDIPRIPDIREDIDWMREQMQAAPAVPDLRSEMERLRMEYQVEPLERQISDYESEIVAAQQRYSEMIAKERDRPGATLEQLRGRAGEIESEMRQEIGFLEARKNVAINQLNQKYSTINTMMGLTVQQYELARQDYEMKFNQAFNLIGLAADNQWRQFDASLNLAKTAYDVHQIERQAALANWQVVSETIHRSIKDGAMNSINDLTPHQLAKLTQMESQANLPEGFTQKVLQNLRPQDEFISSVVSSDETMMSVLVRTPDGLYQTRTISSGLPQKPLTTAGVSGVSGGQTVSDLGINTSAQQKTHFRSFLNDLKVENITNEQMQALWDQRKMEWDLLWDRLDLGDLRTEISQVFPDIRSLR